MCRTMPYPHKKPPWKKIYEALPFVCKYCRGLFPDFKFYRRHIRSHESRYKKFWYSQEWRAARRRFSTSFVDEDDTQYLRPPVNGAQKVCESKSVKRRHSYSHQQDYCADGPKPAIFGRGSRNGYTPRGITLEQAAMIAHYQRLQLSKHKAPERYSYDSDEDMNDTATNGYHNIMMHDVSSLIAQQVEQCKCRDCVTPNGVQKITAERERTSFNANKQRVADAASVRNNAAKVSYRPTKQATDVKSALSPSTVQMLPCPHCPVSFDRADRLALHIKNHYANNVKMQSPCGDLKKSASNISQSSSSGDRRRAISKIALSPRMDKQQYISSMLQSQRSDQNLVSSTTHPLQRDVTTTHHRAADGRQTLPENVTLVTQSTNRQVQASSTSMVQQFHSNGHSAHDNKNICAKVSGSHYLHDSKSNSVPVNANTSNNNNAHLQVARVNTTDSNLSGTKSSFNNNNADRNFNVIQKATCNFHCSECDKTFSTEFELKDHKKYHQHTTAKNHYMKKHALELAEDDSPSQKPYSCSFCPRTFTYWSSLKTHEFGHTGNPPFACNECEEKFTQCSDLKLHERTHFGANSYKCGKCGRLFKHRPSLTAHENSHHGEDGKNICPVCLKTFSVGSNLRDHLRIHTGERPYQCASCGRGFIQKSHLRKHVMIHTGERPFKCQFCSKGFTQRGDVRRHEKIHRKVK